MPAVAPDTSAAKVGTRARSESLVAMMTLSMRRAACPGSAAASAITRKRAGSVSFPWVRRCPGQAHRPGRRPFQGYPPFTRICSCFVHEAWLAYSHEFDVRLETPAGAAALRAGGRAGKSGRPRAPARPRQLVERLGPL